MRIERQKVMSVETLRCCCCGGCVESVKRKCVLVRNLNLDSPFTFQPENLKTVFAEMARFVKNAGDALKLIPADAEAKMMAGRLGQVRGRDGDRGVEGRVLDRVGRNTTHTVLRIFTGKCQVSN